jgi:hypothetical protein
LSRVWGATPVVAHKRINIQDKVQEKFKSRTALTVETLHPIAWAVCSRLFWWLTDVPAAWAAVAHRMQRMTPIDRCLIAPPQKAVCIFRASR